MKAEPELRLTKSRALLRRTKRLIPGGNTFSKSDMFSEGCTPYGAARARGAHIWDVDGNRYLDYVMALGPVLLGYCHPAVDRAIRAQLRCGISLSLVHALESEVAELLTKMLPSAEMVRFGKNGSDSTTAAIRLSRHATRRDHVLFCGYHGWHDWYIGQTSKSGGVPAAVRRLSHRFTYNDIDSLATLLRRHRHEVAAIIIDPCTRQLPRDGFLHEVRVLATRHRCVLVFDEVITGFRLHRGGAQALFGVTPDLTCVGKAIANGMPLSALAGKAALMRRFSDIFYTLTYAGETLSLAAAKAALTIYRTRDVAGHVARLGTRLGDGLRRIIRDNGLDDRLEIQGPPCRPILAFTSGGYDITKVREAQAHRRAVRLIAAMARHGVLFNLSHFISYAHRPADIDRTIRAYADIMPGLRRQW